MSYQTLKVTIRGVSPLLMHNGQTADPLNEYAKLLKKLSGKKAKTDADFEEMARVEWHAGLYLGGGKPCIPGHVMEATLVTAGRRSKLGKQVQAGVFVPDNAPLHFTDEAKAIEKLWEDAQYRLIAGVRVKQNRVMRCRPMFREWSADLVIQFDPNQIDGEQVSEILRVAGESIGMMDWRPRFGRFEVVR